VSGGTLYVVATPIGNLQDLSPRAVAILSAVACIAAEDTRHSRHLLDHFGIRTPLYSLHEHNERHRGEILLQRLLSGEDIALISDAGTPLISDPGYRFVQSALAAGIKVSPIAGPSALIAALSVAGLPADRFVFEGFLSPKASARHSRLQSLKEENRTLVFYEAPHRIEDCVAEMLSVFGAERPAVLLKELSKMFETVKPGNLGELYAWLQAAPEHRKGEFVIVVAGAPEQARRLDPASLHMLAILSRELPLKTAAKLVSEITGIAKNQLYREGLACVDEKNNG
jgi:16S rRNA (cytidine1402-2'-O)-methyltransferase